MVIVDEKWMHPPPPPYIPDVPPPPFPRRRHDPVGFVALPSHLLLKVVYMTFPQTSGVDEGRSERQRKTLYWLSRNLRLVNHSFYVACMHVLRSTYLPAYSSLIRPPYTSDPFPLDAVSISNPNPFSTLQRETQILDLFIALKVFEDVMMDDSLLHLEREDSFRDLFDMMQPRSRIEDLVRYYGVRDGGVHVNVNGSSGVNGTKGKTLPFSALSVSFSPRKVGLVLGSTNGKRTIVEAARTRDEKLEVAAKKLVKQLRTWLAE